MAVLENIILIVLGILLLMLLLLAILGALSLLIEAFDSFIIRYNFKKDKKIETDYERLDGINLNVIEKYLRNKKLKNL